MVYYFCERSWDWESVEKVGKFLKKLKNYQNCFQFFKTFWKSIKIQIFANLCKKGVTPTNLTNCLRNLQQNQLSLTNFSNKSVPNPDFLHSLNIKINTHQKRNPLLQSELFSHFVFWNKQFSSLRIIFFNLIFLPLYAMYFYFVIIKYERSERRRNEITQQHNELNFTIISFLLMLSFTQFLIVFHLVFINIYEASNSFRMLRFFW